MEYDVSASQQARCLGVDRTTLIKAIKEGRCAGELRDGKWYTSVLDASDWHKKHYRHSGEAQSKSSGKTWDEFDILLLKKLMADGVPVQEIAAILRRTSDSVKTKATKLRVAVGVVAEGKQDSKIGKKVDFSVAERFFGVRNDNDIALLLGCSPKTIYRRRVAKGIKSEWGIKHRPRKSNTSRFSDEFKSVKHLIGVENDNIISNIIGCTSEAVYAYRKRRGIQASKKRNRGKRDWPTRYEWAKVAHLMGKKSDVHIAKILGCSIASVLNRRRKLGIGPAIETRVVKKRVAWDKYDHFFESHSDREIADAVGCAIATVWFRRKKLGISAPKAKTCTPSPEK